jgi:hypothetical protein
MKKKFSSNLNLKNQKPQIQNNKVALYERPHFSQVKYLERLVRVRGKIWDGVNSGGKFYDRLGPI